MHYYVTESGDKLPSVTTILKMIHMDDGLLTLANKLGFARKDFNKMMDDAALFGTAVHSELERIIDPTKHTDESPNSFIKLRVATAIDKFYSFIRTFQYETVFTECSLASTELGYGGTLDWLYYEIPDRKLILGDFKTAKKPRLEMFLQLGGYYNLLRHVKDIDVDEAMVLSINERACIPYKVPKTILVSLGESFQKLADFYKSVPSFTEIGIPIS